MNQPEPQSDELEKVLNWQTAAIIEAMVEVEVYGKSKKIVMTEKLLNKHKNKAKQRLEAWGRKQRVDELERVQMRLMSVGVGENKLSKLNAERIAELQGGKND